jgi:hypothetical protein
MNLSLYEARLLPALRKTISHWPPPTEPLRAFTLIEAEINRFLRCCDLSKAEATTQGELWESGVELVYVPGAGLPRFERTLIVGPQGAPPDLYQRLLLLEFQELLFVVYRSLSYRSDEIAELSFLSVIDHVIGQFAMMLSCASQFERDDFWQQEILPNTVFHRRLLRLLRKFLQSTYENAHSTIQVILLDPALASRCRWSPLAGVDGITMMEESKTSKRLSDGESTAFAFSGSGEFFGFYDLSELDKRLASQGALSGVCRWTIRHQSTLQFHLGLPSQRELKLEYSNGEWRYVDVQRIFRVLSQEERSLNGPNRSLWEVALALSDRRKGGLLLITHDPLALVTHSVCNEDELNLPGKNRLEKHLEASSSKLSLKGFLSEQLRGAITAPELTIDLLTRLASIDGALIVSQEGLLIGFGIILKLSASESFIAQEGARTNAAILGSRFGVAIKISADGPISVFKNGAALR